MEDIPSSRPYETTRFIVPVPTSALVAIATLRKRKDPNPEGSNP